MMLVRKLLGCCIIRNLIEIDSRIFLDGIVHGQTCEWFSKVDLYAVVADLGASAYLLCEVTEHGLRQLHHAFVVCVCLIQLHKCELRIVTGIHTLITENASDLVYTLKSADDQSL